MNWESIEGRGLTLIMENEEKALYSHLNNELEIEIWEYDKNEKTYRKISE